MTCGISTILDAINSGEFKMRSKEEIPGPALSEWWKAKGDNSVLLEDYLDKIPLAACTVCRSY